MLNESMGCRFLGVRQEKIKILLTNLLASKKTDFNTDSSVSTKLIFSQKEINLMPKTFKKEFRTDGCSVSVERIAIHTIFATVEMAMILPPPLFLFYLENGFIKYTICFNYFF